MQTVLRVIDNSGARFVRCIGVLKGTGKLRVGNVGDEIVCSVQSADPSSKKVKRGQVFHAVIVRGKVEPLRDDGSWMRTSDTACVLLQDNGEPLGTRVRGVMSTRLAGSKFAKVLGLGSCNC